MYQLSLKQLSIRANSEKIVAAEWSAEKFFFSALGEDEPGPEIEDSIECISIALLVLFGAKGCIFDIYVLKYL